MARAKRIGILTGGGDAPGLNAVIRAVVRSATQAGIECVGIEEGFDGLAAPSQARVLTVRDVAGIHRLGGTILGTTNRGNPLAAEGLPGADPAHFVGACRAAVALLGLDAVLAVGGDGTLAIARELHRHGLPMIGVPKTIDSDLTGTAHTVGFDSAVAFATDAVDRLHTTGEAHRRIMVVEVMGRYTGWIALDAAIAGGADVVLIPELPYRIESVVDHIAARERRGARCSIVVVAEGARPAGGETIVAVPAAAGQVERLGGVGARIAADLECRMKRDVRHDVLGHLQRGGGPVTADRLMATRFGVFAVDLAIRGEVGTMVASQPPALVAIPLDRVTGLRAVPADCDLLVTARRLGICLGT